MCKRGPRVWRSARGSSPEMERAPGTGTRRPFVVAPRRPLRAPRTSFLTSISHLKPNRQREADDPHETEQRQQLESGHARPLLRGRQLGVVGDLAVAPNASLPAPRVQSRAAPRCSAFLSRFASFTSTPSTRAAAADPRTRRRRASATERRATCAPESRSSTRRTGPCDRSGRRRARSRGARGARALSPVAPLGRTNAAVSGPRCRAARVSSRGAPAQLREEPERGPGRPPAHRSRDSEVPPWEGSWGGRGPREKRGKGPTPVILGTVFDRGRTEGETWGSLPPALSL